MRKQKRACLKICALLMSLMLLCVFMPIEAFGESEENIDITSWKITTGGSVKVDLQIEKESDTGEYYLNLKLHMILLRLGKKDTMEKKRKLLHLMEH